MARGRGAGARLPARWPAPWRSPAAAGVLPEDRADLLYHRYDGGGVVVDGPSVLVRKKFADKVSVVANYYLDMVSSASIDVLSTASPFKDERTQMSLGLDYLRGKTTYSIGYIDGDESDYLAKTAYLGISQDMFGDLTTVSIGFRRGQNDVYRNLKEPVSGAKSRDPTFAQEMDTRAWSASLTQVLTRDLIGVLSYELVTDEGYLNNPYRQIRYADADGAARLLVRARSVSAHQDQQFGLRAPEILLALVARRGRRHLPLLHRHLGRRSADDPAGLHAAGLRQLDVRRALPLLHAGRRRLLPRSVPAPEHAELPGRDKELATYTGHTIGVGATLGVPGGRLPWLEKASVNLRYDYMMVSYDDFRDVTAGGAPGAEPLYELERQRHPGFRLGLVLSRTGSVPPGGELSRLRRRPSSHG